MNTKIIKRKKYEKKRNETLDVDDWPIHPIAHNEARQ